MYDWVYPIPVPPIFYQQNNEGVKEEKEEKEEKEGKEEKEEK